MFIPLITKVESTHTYVRITLDNEVELYVSSNHGYLHFSLSGANLPLKIGYAPFVNTEVNNTFDCIYKATRE